MVTYEADNISDLKFWITFFFTRLKWTIWAIEVSLFCRMWNSTLIQFSQHEDCVYMDTSTSQAPKT